MKLSEIYNHISQLGFAPLKLDAVSDIKNPKQWVEYHIGGIKRGKPETFVYETHKYHLMRYYNALLAHNGLPLHNPPKTPPKPHNTKNTERVPLRSDYRTPRELPSEMNVSEVRFNGSDYSPSHDDIRLTGQIQRVFDCMKDGKYRTLAEITSITNDPETSVSSQLRHLRKERFGSHTVSKRSRGSREHGLFEYKLVPNTPECP